MEKKREWEKDFAERVTRQCGFQLKEEDIHADNLSFDYYISCLKPGYPVMLIHYRGPLCAAIPTQDYKDLDSGKITVAEYMHTAHFNWGYMKNDGLIGGVYWQPLEEQGIHNKEVISRYLHILSCRMSKYYTGEDVNFEKCKSCDICYASCPCSPRNILGDWKNEILETRDARMELFENLMAWIDGLGYKLVWPMSYIADEWDLRLSMVKDKKLVVEVSFKLLNELLYHPDVEYDWEEVRKNFNIILNFWGESKEKDVKVPRDLEEEEKKEFFDIFWSEDKETVKDVNITPEQQKTVASKSAWRRFFGRIFS